MRRWLPPIIWMVSAAVVLPGPAHGRPPVAAWKAPVAGELVRRFDAGADPFAPGRHRGIDLAAGPGEPVGAACAGRIAFAGAVAGRRVVTVACGRWRVTHLPLREVAVSAGAEVRRGQRLGSVGLAAGHTGLHVGVRRAGDSFGYVDPWPLLRGSRAGDPAVPPIAWRSRRRRVDRTPPRFPSASKARPGPAVADHAPAVGHEARWVGTEADPRPGDELVRRPAAEDRQRRLAPPVVWLGLALLLAGAWRRASLRRPRAPLPARRAKEAATRAR